MPQIFRRSANTLSKVSLAGILILVGGLIGLAMGLGRSSYVTRQREVVEQPIQFSHLHHVLDDGIDCRYCHTSVETSSFAGIPPTKTCMNCHSQIWSTAPILEPVRASFREDRPLRWIRVHDLPDFVYFNHSIHVKKGMGCETCHGRVDRMPLMYQAQNLQMQWCLDCHRNPENYIRWRDEVFTMGYRPHDEEGRPVSQAELGPKLVAKYAVRPNTSCSTCHR
jgi:Cytochrome c7 and related cytochrome c